MENALACGLVAIIHFPFYISKSKIREWEGHLRSPLPTIEKGGGSHEIWHLYAG